MIIVADAKRRVTLPKSAHPGDAFLVESTGDGRFLLSKLVKVGKSKIKFSREDGYLVASNERLITQDQVRALMDEFP